MSLSPASVISFRIHTCLVMTLHYYEAGMGKTYHLLFMPTAVVFFTGGCVSVAANWLAG
jgi:hypothetical protein